MNPAPEVQVPARVRAQTPLWQCASAAALWWLLGVVGVTLLERVRGEDMSGPAGVFMFGGIVFVLVTWSLWFIGRQRPMRPWLLVLVAMALSAVMFVLLMILMFLVIVAIGLSGGFS